MNGHLSWLVAVELERSQETDIFDGLDAVTGQHDESRFGKGLDTHDAGQHGRAADLMIVQERLLRRVQRGLNGEASVNGHTCDPADHGSWRG